MGAVACHKAAGQYLNGGFAVEFLREGQIVAVGYFQPQVKRSVGQGNFKRATQNRHHLVEFFLVQAAVLFDVLLVVPRGDAGALDGQAHRAAVVGTVEQEGFQQLGVTRHKAGAQAGGVGAFGETGEHHDAAVAATGVRSGLQAADRLVVAEIDFRIAFVGSDGEAVAVLQGKQFFPIGLLHHAAAGVVGRADKHQFHPRPQLGIDVLPNRQKFRRRAVGKMDFGTGQQRRTFVNLIKRIGADDHVFIIGLRV